MRPTAVFQVLGVWLLCRWQQFKESDERGDVPGWVMVTIMTAGLVVAIFAVFRGAIISAIKDAIDGVVSSTGG